jgi:hypothetical protein
MGWDNAMFKVGRRTWELELLWENLGDEKCRELV